MSGSWAKKRLSELGPKLRYFFSSLIFLTGRSFRSARFPVKITTEYALRTITTYFITSRLGPRQTCELKRQFASADF